MPGAADVSFELERFEWTADDRLLVVGHWNGVSGRRMHKPALNVEAGGRRTRVTGSAEADGSDAGPWRATFEWDAARGDVLGAELELGRSLVVELPPPRRRRRSAQVTAEHDLRAAVAELRAERDSLQLELDKARSRDERPDLGAELSAARAELEELRDERPDAERLASSRRDVERLTHELEVLRGEADGSRADAERLAGKVERLRGEAGALDEARAELEALRARAGETTTLRAELDRLRAGSGEAEARAEADLLRTELEALQRDAAEGVAADELAGLRLAHGSLKAAHERLEDELEGMRAVREERDELTGQLQQLRAQSGDEENQRAALGDLLRELQERTTEAENTRDRLSAELSVSREDVARLQGLLAAREEALTSAAADAEQRVETERLVTTEVHERLADAREEAQRSIVAEAEETERLRAELDRTRDDAERLLAAERAEVARLREELLNSEVPDGELDEASRRMVERVQRELDRERAAARALRRELDVLRAESAEGHRSHSNGTLSGDDVTLPGPATPAGRARTPVDAQRRVAAARAGAATRAGRVPPHPVALWAVRFIAAILIIAMIVALVVVTQTVLP